ncbi:hypothetical protein Anas_04458 [Armadillidium nasatum]|uniref:Uncharacterized protein n=1 Tax=Armadillidium nasatum TaxID=96803 RepID=A0A5N5TJ58_9CRUS|nr:hypothetical protein Anas_04458 [Armadillidium nasatum]
MVSEEELAKLAENALLQEARRGALRAEMVGPSGWLKPKLPPTNKKFLQNTIKGAVASNQVKDRKRKLVREVKLEQFEEELKERKRYKKLYIKASTKTKDDKLKTKAKTRVKCNEKDESKSVNGVAWNGEDGLNISCSVPLRVKSKKRKQSTSPKSKNGLTRNISFVKGSNTDKLGVT